MWHVTVTHVPDTVNPVTTEKTYAITDTEIRAARSATIMIGTAAQEAFVAVQRAETQ